MTDLVFQSLVQYSVNVETGEVKVLKKFTVPIKNTKTFNKKPKVVTQMTTESAGQIYL